MSGLDHLIDAAPDAVFIVDVDGLITFWNAGAEGTYGWTAKEALGKPASLLLRTDPAAVDADPSGRLGDAKQWQGDVSRWTKAGNRLLVHTRWSLVDGAILQIDRELLFGALFDSAPDATVCVDETGAITLVNAQAERLLGYDRSELLGRSVEILVPEGLRSAHPHFRMRYFDDPRPRSMGEGRQLQVQRRDGTTFPADISLNALQTGHGVLVSAAIRDLTDRVRAEAERDRLRAEAEEERLKRRIQQSQRLESLGQLAGGVAHDFNNLLGAIEGYGSFVLETVVTAERDGVAPAWSEVRSDMEQVLTASQRAARLVHQLLAFARQESAVAEHVDLNKIVTGIEELLRRTIGEHVELVTQTGDVPLVLIDPGKIEQVIVNLAVNARDAMVGGGKLTIETDSVAIEAGDPTVRPDLIPGVFARLRVTDEGVGMSKEIADRVFEPFFTTKPKGQGTGLGLATAYGIVTQVGGDVQVSSEPGVGTRFTVLLPSDAAAAATAPDPEVSFVNGGSETILLVEDEDGVREVARRILTRAGYRVLTATGGADALLQSGQMDGELDLLISDVVMPGMLGTEVAARMLELRPGLRTLFMSGYAQGVIGNGHGIERGLLEKPFTAEDLLRRVRQALDTSNGPLPL